MRIFGALFWAIPTYFLWNHFAPIYLPDLPPQYQAVPYWHIAGIFILLKIITYVIFPRHRWMKFRGHCMSKFHHFGHHHFGDRFGRHHRRKHATVKYYHPG